MNNINDIQEPSALGLNIQRMSTEDGPGLRTTIFFKGCSLSCEWCHNPESISSFKEIQWVKPKCIGCKSCIEACQFNAIKMAKRELKIERDICKRCLKCAEVCPTLAIEVKGENWKLSEIVSELLKDKAYFKKSNGGVTASGGEASLQSYFVSRLFRELKANGVSTALDTCGNCSEEALIRIIGHTDIVLYDLKLMDGKLHKKFTGSSNELLLKNAEHIANYVRKNNNQLRLWIRTPIIPNTTAFDQNIKEIGKFISEKLNGVVERWDLCAFNNLCRDKYKRLDMDWVFKQTELLSKEEMVHFAKVAKKSVINPEIVHWSGATKVDDN